MKTRRGALIRTLEQRGFPLGEFDVAAARPPLTVRVTRSRQQPVDPQRRTAVGSADQCPYPGEQFGHLEGLDQIVLSARVEALDPVGDRAPRGQQQYRGGDSAGPEHRNELGRRPSPATRDRRSWRRSVR